MRLAQRVGEVEVGHFLGNSWAVLATLFHEGGGFMYVGLLISVVCVVRFGRNNSGK